MLVDKNEAHKILVETYQKILNNKSVDNTYKGLIDYVIDNNHLTYKYILFTAILAKATNENINILSLQKKSLLPGAYDARTICHKVVVPFEIEVLDKVLGGSNEPFLNKPARFTELDKNNAVRRGNDKLILDKLCNQLPLINTKNKAQKALEYLLKKLVTLKETKERIYATELSIIDTSKISFLHFINDVLEKNFEGEALTLIVGGLYFLLLNNPIYKIHMHPVNECGASSREVSDLDVYYNEKLFITNELKDKDCTHIDIKHAVDKVIENKGNQLNFILGKHSKILDKQETLSLLQDYEHKGFFLNIVNINDFVNNIVILIPKINIQEFMKFIAYQAKMLKFMDDTFVYIKTIANLYFS